MFLALGLVIEFLTDYSYHPESGEKTVHDKAALRQARCHIHFIINKFHGFFLAKIEASVGPLSKKQQKGVGNSLFALPDLT